MKIKLEIDSMDLRTLAELLHYVLKSPLPLPKGWEGQLWSIYSYLKLQYEKESK